jgi:hypothetical protein
MSAEGFIIGGFGALLLGWLAGGFVRLAVVRRVWPRRDVE